MSKKPLVTVAKDVSVRRSYSVPEEVATDLENYALFLSEFNGAKVSAGDIVGKLAAKLGKDPLFLDWKKNAGAQKSAPVSARSVKREGDQKEAPIGTRAPNETSLARAPRPDGNRKEF